MIGNTTTFVQKDTVSRAPVLRNHPRLEDFVGKVQPSETSD